jgi:hypothetical protein
MDANDNNTTIAALARFLLDTAIHVPTTFAVALDKARRTGGFLRVCSISMTGQIVPTVMLMVRDNETF